MFFGVSEGFYFGPVFLKRMKFTLKKKIKKA